MEYLNQINGYLPQLITFLTQHKYEIKGYESKKTDQNILSDLQIQHEEHFLLLRGTKTHLEQNQQVCIKISYSDASSYEIVKQEASILKDLLIFKSVVQFVDEFDFEDQSLFILITESYEKFVQSEIDVAQKYNDELALVNVYYRILFSIFELHENNYFHGNINPNSIVVDGEGNYKFINLVTKEYLFHNFNSDSQNISSNQEIQLEQIQQKKEFINSSLYISPEIKKIITKRKTNQIEEILQFLKQSDVYSLGLVFLTLLGVQINKTTIKQIKHQCFDDILKVLPQNKIKLISFVRNFMLNYKPSLRATSFQLRKGLFQQYEEVYLFKEKELLKLKELVKFYEQNKKLTEHYKAYLVFQLIQFDLVYNNYMHLHYTKNLLINLDRSSYEKDHFLIHELGITYYYFKDFKKYVAYCFKALEIRQKIYPKNHQFIAESLKELGNGYKHIETNCEKSFTYKSEALNIYKSLYENSHELIAQTFQSIGSDFLLYKKYQQAQLFLTQSLEIRKQLYVDNHLFISENISELIKCYKLQSEYDKCIFWNLKNFKIKYFLFKQISYEDLTYVQSLIIKIKDPQKRLKYNLKILKQLNKMENCNLQYKAELLNSISSIYFEIKDYENYKQFGNHSKNLLNQK
ncbi:kinase domain protein (macronuclear) [Tetrahymena thermophila SB210]|uniref:Kinase domain protein n=1 Tax=Tetrahymena thermophila (strain SB210) TaxID=312017 RepID=Q23Q73_TETTS|nr:kinase domain protein [Tetrahymena thermophila SB210]EAR98711.1 kinase domain protein [Tetrahymena thermophila SB210]|eukprot:XP_001018956.1 kinase domain protein [Tetrahymena thermophila SB210]